MEGQVIVEEKASQEEVKLNFSNLFAFLSSLDYLRFLELEGAFDGIKSQELYYTYERVALAGFVLKHVVGALTGAYFLVLLAGTYLFSIDPLKIAVGLAALYTLLGFILVERYTIGSGYLYLVFRDFLLNTLVFTFFAWILSDVLLFYLFPKALELFGDFLASPSAGKLNDLLYSALHALWTSLSPLLYRLKTEGERMLKIYALVAPTKAFSLLLVYAYFLYLSRSRRDKLQWKIERFKRRA